MFTGPTHKLERDEVHVWQACLDRSTAYVQSLQRILSADEQTRAARFRFERDRKHFIVARGLLRLILSHYLDLELSQLRFCYSRYGKPSLVPPLGREAYKFNVSHAGGLALYAITSGRQIGIDVESIRADIAYEQIAAQFFSSHEQHMLRALPEGDVRLRAFFNCWVRKEAYVKARGMGLSLRLNQFDVALVPGEPAALLDTREASQQASQWSLQELIPGPGYVAALAVEGHGWQLVCWHWPE